MHSDSSLPSILFLLKQIQTSSKKKKKSRQGLEDSTEEGVLVETASCPVTAGWLCDKTGALTAQGERHVFIRGCLHRQQFGVSGLHGLCFLGLILSKFQIHIFIERTKVLLQLVLPARISLQCARLLVTRRHRNQGPDSPGNSWCQSSLLYLREYLRQWFPETEYFIDVMRTGKNIGVHCLYLGRATGDLMGFGMFTLVWWCLCKVAASLVLDEDTRGCSQKVFTSTRCSNWLCLAAGFPCCSVNTDIILTAIFCVFKDKYIALRWLKLFWSPLTFKIPWWNFPLYFKCCCYIIDESFSSA